MYRFIILCYLLLFLVSVNIFANMRYVTKYKDEPIYDYRVKPVYKVVTERYQDYEEKVVTERVKILIPPIIKRGNIILAFTRFAGENEAELEQISEAIKIGFASEKINSKKNIKFISRAQLLRKLTRSELNDI